MGFRSAVKEVIYNMACHAGVPHFALKRLGRKTIVLTYHSFCVQPRETAMNAMPIGRFDQQIRYLRKYFEIIPFSHMIQEWREGDAGRFLSDRPRVVLTIDDGFEDNYRLMFDVLRRQGVPAVVFLATDFIDNGRPPWPTQIGEIIHRTRKRFLDYPEPLPLHDEEHKMMAMRRLKALWKHLEPHERFARIGELRGYLKVSEEYRVKPLKWVQIREMSSCGIEFGSHTVYHSILPFISGACAEEEIGLSKTRIEAELDMACRFFAYPNGDWNEMLATLVKRAGYGAAVTQDRGFNDVRTDVHALRRVEIPCNESIGSFACRSSLSAL